MFDPRFSTLFTYHDTTFCTFSIFCLHPIIQSLSVVLLSAIATGNSKPYRFCNDTASGEQDFELTITSLLSHTWGTDCFLRDFFKTCSGYNKSSPTLCMTFHDQLLQGIPDVSRNIEDQSTQLQLKIVENYRKNPYLLRKCILPNKATIGMQRSWGWTLSSPWTLAVAELGFMWFLNGYGFLLLFHTISNTHFLHWLWHWSWYDM